MKTILNYLGQLRVYSLADLVLLLVAIGATKAGFVGVLCLHVGFLAYLESKHLHTGRASVPKWLWMPVVFVGGCFYQHWQIIPFLVCSFLYTKKNGNGWGMSSPFFRGLQMMFLTAGVAHIGCLPLVVFTVFVIRNTIGDLRDAGKDKARGMKTLPILFGAVRNVKSCHLVAMIASTIIWWSLTDFSGYVLLGVILVQIATYNLTPR